MKAGQVHRVGVTGPVVGHPDRERQKLDSGPGILWSLASTPRPQTRRPHCPGAPALRAELISRGRGEMRPLGRAPGPPAVMEERQGRWEAVCCACCETELATRLQWGSHPQPGPRKALTARGHPARVQTQLMSSSEDLGKPASLLESFPSSCEVGRGLQVSQGCCEGPTGCVGNVRTVYRPGVALVPAAVAKVGSAHLDSRDPGPPAASPSPQDTPGP